MRSTTSDGIGRGSNERTMWRRRTTSWNSMGVILPEPSSLSGIPTCQVGFSPVTPLRRTIAVPTFRDLLSQAKSKIREIDTAEAEAALAADGAVALDVRESDEYEQG